MENRDITDEEAKQILSQLLPDDVDNELVASYFEIKAALPDKTNSELINMIIRMIEEENSREQMGDTQGRFGDLKGQLRKI